MSTSKKTKSTARTKRLSKGATSEKRRVQAAKVAAIIVEKPALAVGDAIREAGLSEHLATHPSKLTETKEWAEMLDEFLPNTDVLTAHRGLLKASHIDHLVFTRGGEPTDEEIKLMLEEVGCTLRKIVHGEQARHAYFFAPDNRARKDALDMVYKMRGSYAVDKAAVAFSLAALAQSRDKSVLNTPPSTLDTLLPASSDVRSLPRPVDDDPEADN